MSDRVTDPDTPSAKPYWRGLEELADTPEFRAFVGREFPGYTNLFAGEGEAEGEGFDRRRFLQLMGASLALAGLAGTGCRRPNLELLPYNRRPEEVIPGLPTYYATSIPRPEAPFPVIVESHEGRPTKIEGNPRHPFCRVEPDKGEDPEGRFTRGGTDVFAQASILDLYNPDRSGVLKQGAEDRTWQEFDIAADTYFTKFLGGQENSGEGLHFLAEEANSPALKLVRDFLKTKAPKATWHAYDPLRRENTREGARLAFGKPLAVTYRLERADVVLALDSDFLGCDEWSVPLARDFAKRRKVESPDDADRMNRLYVVESTYTVTGAAADHRLRMPASQIAEYTTALAREVLTQLRAAGKLPREAAPALDALTPRQPPAGVSEKWLKVAAADLVRARGKSVILVGGRQPPAVQALGHLLNECLDNHTRNEPRPVELRPASAPDTASLDELVTALRARKVDTLVIIGGNPIYDAPADLEFPRLMANVPFRIRLGLTYDETAHACCTAETDTGWYLPMTHYLEEWGDVESADGTYGPVQPLIAPLYGARSALETVARLARHPKPSPYDLVQQSFRQRTGQQDENPAPFRRFLHEGWWPDSTRKPETAALAWPAVIDQLRKLPAPTAPPSRERMEITFHPDSRLLDGRYASNGWLQELPDPITKLTWDNALLVSPRTAQELGLKTQDLVDVTLNGVTAQLAVYVLPGQADWSLAVTLGGGRSRVGRLAHAGGRLGFNVYPLRTSAVPHFALGVTVAKTGQTYAMATTQIHGSLEGRDIIRTFDTERFRQHVAAPRHSSGRIPLPLQSPDLAVPNPALDQKQGWGMVIDLNACTACNACVVACQAENNVPIVGKGEVIRGREMHWLRVDRYFTEPDEGAREQPGTTANVDDPAVAHQLMMCVHCEQAPCEAVCPVNAAAHSPEGLNLQVYNRCVGTRYCENNCPWKVRRFNFFDYNQRPLDQLRLGPLTEKGTSETLKMQKNPDVTVRMRGVMEKCTYCVQRIERGKIGTKLMRVREGSTDFTVPDGVITPACAQACPSGAIVFGNVKDPHSRVARVKRRNPRDYLVLGELNTKPRTSYLARVRNLNRAMTDAPARPEGHE
jgi:molybdopterin-containing oxidoreductase family iron-sulfur binding subunit